jgi:hypothetical protein
MVVFDAGRATKGEYVDVLVTGCTSATLMGSAVEQTVPATLLMAG